MPPANTRTAVSIESMEREITDLNASMHYYSRAGQRTARKRVEHLSRVIADLRRRAAEPVNRKNEESNHRA